MKRCRNLFCAGDDGENGRPHRNDGLDGAGYVWTSQINTQDVKQLQEKKFTLLP